MGEFDDLNQLDVEEFSGDENYFTQETTEEQETVEETQQTYESSDDNRGDDSLIPELLKYYGIDDPSKIKFANEDGTIKDTNWDELSFDEKLNILKSSTTSPERDLNDQEIAMLNFMRANNITPDQFVNNIQNQAVQNYKDSLNGNPQSQISVDDLTDEEIFILDLQDKIEGITDEEIEEMLETAKQNGALFIKRVNSIRTELKQQEQDYLQQIELDNQQQRQDEFNQFSNQILDSISNLKQIGNLDIELNDNDMNEIADFILAQDQTGLSNLGKALNNTNNLVEMTWWLLHGKQTLDDIERYYNKEISNVRQRSYEKGLNDGRQNKQPSVAIKSKPIKVNSVSELDSIW